MTSTLAQTIESWANTHRPLKAMTKDQLFTYYYADTSIEAAWKFTREVCHRRGIHRLQADKVDEIRRRLDSIERRAVNGYPDTQEGQLQKKSDLKYFGFVQDDLKKAEAELASIGTKDHALSHVEVLDHFRKRYLPEYQQQLRAWKEGSLFLCHNWGWTRFISCTKDEHHADRQAYKVVETLAHLSGQEESQDFIEIKRMYTVRIMPALSMRGLFLDEEGQMVTIASLNDTLKSFYWEWWRKYNTATLRNNWADESGIAYDTRIFKPDVEERK